MTLTQLQYFLTVYRLQNIKAASETLHISQPAVSGAIRDLENEFHINLFGRTTKGTFPTEKCKIFAEQVEDLLFRFERLNVLAKDLSSSNSDLRCGVSPMLGSCIFPDIYNCFHQLYPDIYMEIITEKGLYTLYRMLEKDELDILLVPALELPEYLAHYRILEDPLLFCIRKDHPLAAKEALALADLAEVPLTLLPEGYLQYKLVQERFRQGGIQPNVLMLTNQLNVIRSFVSKGASGGFFYKTYVDNNFLPEQVKSFDIGLPKIPFEIVWKKEGYLLSSTKKLIQLVEERKWVTL